MSASRLDQVQIHGQQEAVAPEQQFPGAPLEAREPADLKRGAQCAPSTRPKRLPLSHPNCPTCPCAEGRPEFDMAPGSAARLLRFGARGRGVRGTCGGWPPRGRTSRPWPSRRRSSPGRFSVPHIGGLDWRFRGHGVVFPWPSTKKPGVKTPKPQSK